MSERVCVFVDGENFRHVICDLFTDFDPRDYLPKNAEWGAFFDWLVSEVAPSGRRLRTYWYVIEFIDFFPYKLPHADKDPEKLRRVLSKYEPLEEELRTLSGSALVEKMKNRVSGLREKQGRMRRRLDGWTTLQNAISVRHPAVEFRRAGGIRYNLFDESLGQEKAVDVKLAADLIMLRDIYDIAVVVSGDQDYVPAVQVIKDCGKRVINVSFETRSGKLLPGGAWRLNQASDWGLRVPYDAFRKYLAFDTTGSVINEHPSSE